MIIALLTLELFLPGAASLKDKRAVVRPLLERIRRDWNAAATETDHHETWQRAGLAVVTVNTEAGRGEESLRGILRLVEANPAVEVLASAVQVLPDPT